MGRDGQSLLSLHSDSSVIVLIRLLPHSPSRCTTGSATPSASTGWPWRSCPTTASARRRSGRASCASASRAGSARRLNCECSPGRLGTGTARLRDGDGGQRTSGTGQRSKPGDAEAVQVSHVVLWCHLTPEVTPNLTIQLGVKDQSLLKRSHNP